PAAARSDRRQARGRRGPRARALRISETKVGRTLSGCGPWTRCDAPRRCQRRRKGELRRCRMIAVEDQIPSDTTRDLDQPLAREGEFCYVASLPDLEAWADCREQPI